MKILIVSRLFYPSNRIGAVRPSNFAKYLAIFGHDITLITDEIEIKGEKLGEDFKQLNIKRISNSNWVKKIKNKNDDRVLQNRVEVKSDDKKKKSIFKLIKSFLLMHLSKVFFLIIEFNWSNNVIKDLKKANKNYDLVFSSFGPLGSFLVGYNLYKLKIATHWISDFRDNMTSENNLSWLNALYMYYERCALKYASRLLFVSEGQKKMFINKHKKGNFSNIHVLYNGFENEPNSTIITTNNKLKITYTGQLYSGKRDFKIIFHALDDLLNENKINSKHIQIEYAGPHSSELQNQAKPFSNITEVINDHGMLTREKALLLQQESDILVALTWNTKKEQGVLTGKFLEYLQQYKPIIAITSGNLPNGELTVLTRKMNMGLACEYVKYSEDYEILKIYILKQYQLKQNHKKVDFKPNFDKVNKFHYENISKELNLIISSF